MELLLAEVEGYAATWRARSTLLTPSCDRVPAPHAARSTDGALNRRRARRRALRLLPAAASDTRLSSARRPQRQHGRRERPKRTYVWRAPRDAVARPHVRTRPPRTFRPGSPVHMATGVTSVTPPLSGCHQDIVSSKETSSEVAGYNDMWTLAFTRSLLQGIQLSDEVRNSDV
jgi:hypothetical protein